MSEDKNQNFIDLLHKASKTNDSKIRAKLAVEASESGRGKPLWESDKVDINIASQQVPGKLPSRASDN